MILSAEIFPDPHASHGHLCWLLPSFIKKGIHLPCIYFTARVPWIFVLFCFPNRPDWSFQPSCASDRWHHTSYFPSSAPTFSYVKWNYWLRELFPRSFIVQSLILRIHLQGIKYSILDNFPGGLHQNGAVMSLLKSSYTDHQHLDVRQVYLSFMFVIWSGHNWSTSHQCPVCQLSRCPLFPSKRKQYLWHIPERSLIRNLHTTIMSQWTKLIITVRQFLEKITG